MSDQVDHCVHAAIQLAWVLAVGEGSVLDETDSLLVAGASAARIAASSSSSASTLDEFRRIGGLSELPLPGRPAGTSFDRLHERIQELAHERGRFPTVLLVAGRRSAAHEKPAGPGETPWLALAAHAAEETQVVACIPMRELSPFGLRGRRQLGRGRGSDIGDAIASQEHARTRLFSAIDGAPPPPPLPRVPALCLSFRSDGASLPALEFLDMAIVAYPRVGGTCGVLLARELSPESSAKAAMGPQFLRQLTGVLAGTAQRSEDDVLIPCGVAGDLGLWTASDYGGRRSSPNIYARLRKFGHPLVPLGSIADVGESGLVIAGGRGGFRWTYSGPGSTGTGGSQEFALRSDDDDWLHAIMEAAEFIDAVRCSAYGNLRYPRVSRKVLEQSWVPWPSKRARGDALASWRRTREGVPAAIRVIESAITGLRERQDWIDGEGEEPASLSDVVDSRQYVLDAIGRAVECLCGREDDGASGHVRGLGRVAPLVKIARRAVAERRGERVRSLFELFESLVKLHVAVSFAVILEADRPSIGDSPVFRRGAEKFLTLGDWHAQLRWAEGWFADRDRQFPLRDAGRSAAPFDLRVGEAALKAADALVEDRNRWAHPGRLSAVALRRVGSAVERRLYEFADRVLGGTDSVLRLVVSHEISRSGCSIGSLLLRDPSGTSPDSHCVADWHDSHLPRKGGAYLDCGLLPWIPVEPLVCVQRRGRVIRYWSYKGTSRGRAGDRPQFEGLFGNERELDSEVVDRLARELRPSR